MPERKPPPTGDTEERARRELDDAAGSQTFAESAMAKAARRTGAHFSGRDADEPPEDAVELWGRRIGRALSLIGVIGLAIYLFVTYVWR